MGGPGVQRSVRLVKHLPEHGFAPVVLTISLADVQEYLYPLDHSLLPADDPTEIVRVPTREPRRLRGWLVHCRLYRLLWFFGYPLVWENSALWPFAAYRTARHLVRERGIRLVYTSSAPFSAVVLGALLRLTTNVKWVADLRDPFTDAYARKWPSKLHWYFCRVMEHLLYRVPDKLVVNTPETERLFCERGVTRPERLTHITNGFDP